MFYLSLQRSPCSLPHFSLLLVSPFLAFFPVLSLSTSLHHVSIILTSVFPFSPSSCFPVLYLSFSVHFIFLFSASVFPYIFFPVLSHSFSLHLAFLLSSSQALSGCFPSSLLNQILQLIQLYLPQLCTNMTFALIILQLMFLNGISISPCNTCGIYSFQ